MLGSVAADSFGGTSDTVGSSAKTAVLAARKDFLRRERIQEETPADPMMGFRITEGER